MIPGLVVTPQAVGRAVRWTFSVARFRRVFPGIWFLRPMAFVRAVPPGMN